MDMQKVNYVDDFKKFSHDLEGYLLLILNTIVNISKLIYLFNKFISSCIY